MATVLIQQRETAQAEYRQQVKRSLVRDRKQAEEEYNKIAPYYSVAFQHHAVDIGPFVSFADLRPGHRVLELGCGAGWVTLRAAQLVTPGGGNVVAIDASGRCLRQASTLLKLAEVHEHVKLLKEDITKLDQIPALRSSLGSCAAFDRILLCWVMPLIPAEDQVRFLRSLAAYLSPGGRIVLTQDHEYNDLACLDALPFDGSSNTGELHWLVADKQSFDEAQQFTRSQISKANLHCLKIEDCYRDKRYGYEDHAAGVQQQANDIWKKEGGTSSTCSRLYLEHIKRSGIENMKARLEKEDKNAGIKYVCVLAAAERPVSTDEKGGK